MEMGGEISKGLQSGTLFFSVRKSKLLTRNNPNVMLGDSSNHNY